MTTATLIAAAASLALLAGWLWWLADRRDEALAMPADDEEDDRAEVSETTPAEDGRLRLQGLRPLDRLALDALLQTPTRSDLRPWYQTENDSRQAAPTPTAGPGGQREP